MAAPFIPQIRLYQNWLRDHRGLSFDSYDELWRWSTQDLCAFWQSVWDYFDLQSPTPYTAVLAEPKMPGAKWFEGAQFNYAQQVFRHVDKAHAAGFPAVISRNEKGEYKELGWPELQRQVAALALHLREQGLRPGDRVAAYMPNIPETMVAFLAVISVGGIWSVCAPDMGTNAVLDRFRQIEPAVLIACDGVTYGGRDFDRTAVVAELRAALPSVRHLIVHRNLGVADAALTVLGNWTDMGEAVARDDSDTAAFQPMWLPFDHPLWIVYSSGTTGLPKPIVHGHGGTVLVALALKVLHNDIGCSYDPNSWGERFHWYSSTGWVMWNAQTSGLLHGTTCCLYDGNPGGSKEAPDWTVLWRFAADLGVTFFGAGAAFYANCMKAGIDLASCGDLRSVRALGTTGSPLSEDAQRWGTSQFRKLRAQPIDRSSTGAAAPAANVGAEQSSAAGPPQGARAPLGGSAAASAASVGAEQSSAAGPPQGARAPLGGSAAASAASVGADIWWCNISGGTDFAGAFIGGNRELPLVPGEMQCRLLGCAVEAWNERGQPVIDEVGELVCTQPIPSMPLYFWGDEGVMEPPGGGAAHPPRGSGSGLGRPGARIGPRYLSSYFDMYPGVWRHGDWLKITSSGSCIIYGRSDATINRYGLRMGTSELYSAVEALPEVLDSLVVDLEYLGRESYMPLFVVLRPGAVLDDEMRAKINDAIKTALSPRFVPNDIFAVAEVPRTLSGKKQELPVKKLLLGHPLEKVVNPDAMANPRCLDWYVAFARERQAAAS